ncbi:MAG: hypothetical protein WD063_08425 [Pirellulales bacterium]
MARNPAHLTPIWPKSSPLGIAVSGENLFVVNYSLGTIGEYTTCGATVNGNLVSGLTQPYGIAVSGENLFVTNVALGTIGEYTTSGATVNASLITGLFGPTGIEVSGSGKIKDAPVAPARCQSALKTSLTQAGWF